MPSWAKVKLDRRPNAYDTEALRLRVSVFFMYEFFQSENEFFQISCDFGRSEVNSVKYSKI